MARPGMGVGNAATVTLTRAWVYNATTQRLTSVTHPESGTTSYTYNGDGTVLQKTDAKGQRVKYEYDAEGRVTARRRYANGADASQDLCGAVGYYYGSQSFDAAFTQNAAGRLAATATGCSDAGPGILIEMYSYTAAGAVTKKRMRVVRAGSQNQVDKDVTYGYASDGTLMTVLYPGATVPYSYTYDSMYRPARMTGPSTVSSRNVVDHAKDVVYGAAGQVTSMSYHQGEIENYNSSGDLFGVPYYLGESRVYNALYQMTKQTTTGRSAMGVYGTTLAELEYYYADGQNNGRISRRKNNISGQDVSYGYDALNRLTGATNSGSGAWAQTFLYDGFGNLRAQDATAGTAPEVLDLDVDMTTNRLTKAGWAYDLNGNAISMPVLGGGTATVNYDIDNRLVTWLKGTVGTEEYAYLPDNKRVWKKAPNGTETVYFYGAGGQKLVTCAVQASPFRLVEQSANVYFGGKLIRADGAPVAHDRLGSVVWREGVGAGKNSPLRRPRREHDVFALIPNNLSGFPR